jgi:hypothetical protein
VKEGEEFVEDNGDCPDISELTAVGSEGDNGLEAEHREVRPAQLGTPLQ